MDVTSKRRIWLANELEKKKNEKYNGNEDIQGLGLQVLGGMSDAFRGLLNSMAQRMEFRSNVHWTIWLNRFRSQLMATLIQQNCKMIKMSYFNYFAAE